MTMNSPDSLTQLFNLASDYNDSNNNNNTEEATAEAEAAITTAEFMREVGLKCISFNGIPRTINSLNAFRANLPARVTKNLSRTVTRAPSSSSSSDGKSDQCNTPAEIQSRGLALWTSVYRPLEKKLYDKLADAHPDLPVVIVNYHYGALLADPPAPPPKTEEEETERARRRRTMTTGKVGRLCTSIVAIACLRAQSGVGPQVTSHVFGLKKALEDGSWVDDERNVESEQGAKWLASDEGLMWILDSVDEIVQAIGDGMGSSFAPLRAKL